MFYMIFSCLEQRSNQGLISNICDEDFLRNSKGLKAVNCFHQKATLQTLKKVQSTPLSRLKISQGILLFYQFQIRKQLIKLKLKESSKQSWMNYLFRNKVRISKARLNFEFARGVYLPFINQNHLPRIGANRLVRTKSTFPARDHLPNSLLMLRKFMQIN